MRGGRRRSRREGAKDLSPPRSAGRSAAKPPGGGERGLGLLARFRHLHRTPRRWTHARIVVRFTGSLHRGFGGVPMSWSVEGTYFENCNCDFACPCLVTSFAAPATQDRCTLVLAYH